MVLMVLVTTLLTPPILKLVYKKENSPELEIAPDPPIAQVENLSAQTQDTTGRPYTAEML
jgi:hypothetical protein